MVLKSNKQSKKIKQSPFLNRSLNLYVLLDVHCYVKVVYANEIQLKVRLVPNHRKNWLYKVVKIKLLTSHFELRPQVTYLPNKMNNFGCKVQPLWF